MKMLYTNNWIKITRRLPHIFTAMVLLSFSHLHAQQSNTPVFKLNHCIEIALKNNPQILASGLTVEESRARIGEVKAGYYPTLSLSASGSQSTWENGTGGTGKTSMDNWSGGLSARYPIFQGFKTVARENAAKANFQANGAWHKTNQQDLVVRVTEAYYRLLQLERLVQVAEQSVQRAQKHLDFSNALFNTGLASRSDILKAKVAQSDAQLAMIRTRNAHLAARGQLNLQMGRAVQLPLKIVDDLETAASPADSSFGFNENRFEKYLQRAFKNRSELERINQQIRAQQANIRFARGDYFPTFSVEGSYSYAGETTSDLNASSYIGLSLSVPLFSGFSRPARVKQENLALRNLEQQQESLCHEIGAEVWNAYLQVKEAAERVSNSRIFYENALESRNIAEGEYREGVGSMLDVIDAQTAFVTAEQTLIEALADYKIALAVLDRAAGIINV
ncbi:MAG: TolC family protein [Candidatus Krumholzibacteriales bacterium]